MKKMYITFGQCHRHEVCGEVLDKDTVGVIECESYARGRTKTWSLFGAKFCTTYFDSEWSESKNLPYFPKGYVNLK